MITQTRLSCLAKPSLTRRYALAKPALCAYGKPEERVGEAYPKDTPLFGKVGFVASN
jgi:hypothetical protein